MTLFKKRKKKGSNWDHTLI